MRKLLCLLFVIGGVPAFAQVPSGTFSYALTNTPLWDTTGSYTNSVTADGVTDDSIVNITVTANGQVTGDRHDQIFEGEDHADINGALSGKISVKGGAAATKLKETGTVTGVFAGASFAGTANGSSLDTLDADALTVVSTGTINVCPEHSKCKSFSGTAIYALPAGMNGDWTLDTDIGSAGTKLTGTGTITLSNGRELGYQITGSYNSKSQSSKLKLVGEGDAVGTSLSLTTQGAGMDLTALKAKVLGQTLTLP